MVEAGRHLVLSMPGATRRHVGMNSSLIQLWLLAGCGSTHACGPPIARLPAPPFRRECSHSLLDPVMVACRLWEHSRLNGGAGNLAIGGPLIGAIEPAACAT